MAMNMHEAIYNKGMGQGVGSDEYNEAIRRARNNGLIGGGDDRDPEYEAESRMSSLDSLVIVQSNLRLEGDTLIELRGGIVLERRKIDETEKELTQLLADLHSKEEYGYEITLDDISYLDVQAAQLVAEAYDREVEALSERDPRFMKDTLYRIATEAEFILSEAAQKSEALGTTDVLEATENDDTAEVVAQIEAAERMVKLLTEEAEDEDPEFAQEARDRLTIAITVLLDLNAHLTAGEVERIYGLAA
jgi:hypothetical protein